VVTKTEKAEVDPNQAAVKNVATNTGNPDKRWSFNEEIKLPENLIFRLQLGEPKK